MNSKTTVILIVVLAGLLVWVGGSGSLAQGEGGVGPQAVLTPLLQYQGRLTDPGTGEPVADGNYTMTFRLYDAATGGSALWTETEDVSVQGGLFSTVLGDTTALDQALFNGQALWLGVKVMADAEATPRQQVLPVAYALSLVPGARVTGESDGQPALRLNHTGDGNALLGIISSTNPDRTAIFGANYGGGYGVGGYTNSDESAAVGGYNDGAGPAVRGESVAGAGGYFTSTNSYGVYGYSGNSNGVRGEAMGSGAGVSGVNLGDGPGGYFSSSSGPTLYADGSAEVTGDLTVGGSLTGGSHAHDDRYYTEGESDGRFVNTTGPEWISGSSPDPILGLAQTGSGEALYVEGLTILDGDLNVSGSLTGGSHDHDDLYYPKGESDGRFVNAEGPEWISGSSPDPILEVVQGGTGVGGHFTSAQNHGVLGDGGDGAGDYGGWFEGWGGVAGFGGSGYGGYFNSSSGLALYAAGDAEVTGDFVVGGTFEAPRTRYVPITVGDLMYDEYNEVNTGDCCNGILFPDGSQSGGSITFPLPDDYDYGTSFNLDLYLIPLDSGSGALDFYVRWVGLVEGGWSGTGSSVTSSAAPLGSVNYIHRQSFTLSGFGAGSPPELVELTVRRISTDTYGGRVTLVGLRLSYQALR